MTEQNLDDAELLDMVRKLRTYLSVLDNSHMILFKLAESDLEADVPEQSSTLVPGLSDAVRGLSNLLKSIESTRRYKSMVRRFNLGDTDV